MVFKASNGTLQEEASYSTYGVQAITTGSKVTPFGFKGSYSDPTGLLYMENRYYDPSTGQFISLDPDVQSTGQPYSYANDDPVNASDPSGLFEVGPDGQQCSGQTCNTAEQNTADAEHAAEEAQVRAYLQAMQNYVNFCDAVLGNELRAFGAAIAHSPGATEDAAAAAGPTFSSQSFQEIAVINEDREVGNQPLPVAQNGPDQGGLLFSIVSDVLVAGFCLDTGGLTCLGIGVLASGLQSGIDYLSGCGVANSIVDGAIGALGAGTGGLAKLGEGAFTEASPMFEKVVYKATTDAPTGVALVASPC